MRQRDKERWTGTGGQGQRGTGMGRDCGTGPDGARESKGQGQTEHVRETGIEEWTGTE